MLHVAGDVWFCMLLGMYWDVYSCAGVVDAGVVDAGVADAGVVDAGVVDAGVDGGVRLGRGGLGRAMLARPRRGRCEAGMACLRGERWRFRGVRG